MEPTNEQNSQQILPPSDETPTTNTGKPNFSQLIKRHPIKSVVIFIVVLMIVGLSTSGNKSNQQTNTESQSAVKTTTKPISSTPTNSTTPDLTRKLLGNCTAPNTKEYTVTHCVNLQVSSQKDPSRNIIAVINPSNDTPKAKIQEMANQLSVSCDTIADCVIDILDDAHAADLQYQEDLMSSKEADAYIHNPKNSNDIGDMTDHLIAEYDPPDPKLFTYYFIPTTTPSPSPSPIPKDANGFPLDAEAVTVSQIAKVPSAYNGQKITFTCTVSSFAKNDAGDAAALNCSDPNDLTSIVQIDGSLFDMTKINQEDTVRIYGVGAGAATGKNAFGGDVSEAVVTGVFINDVTSNYKN